MIKIQGDLLLQAREAQERRDNQNIARRTPIDITEFPINSYVLIGYPKTRRSISINPIGFRPSKKEIEYIRNNNR
jgi:hypothetical protein